MQRIKTDIKTGVFSNIYLLYGDENYLTDYYSKQIASKCVDEGTEDMNLLKLSSPLPEEDEIDGFINSYPFMSDKKVILIHNSGILKKATESQKNFWNSIIDSVPEYAVIIFAEESVDKRNAIYKKLSKSAVVCECKYQSATELASWVTRIFKSYGKDISRQDAINLAEMCGPGMYNLKNEVEKLASYALNKSEVTTDDIERAVCKNVENKVFDMVDDVVCARSADAMKKLNDLKFLGEEPIKIISIIFNKFSTYKKISTLKGRSIREICSICGLYEKYARIYISQLQKMSARQIDAVMEACMKADFDIKNGKTDKWLAIELILSEAMKK